VEYLLDTCVISKLVRSQPAQVVVEWFRQQSEHDLYLSVLAFGEIEKGIKKQPVQFRSEKEAGPVGKARFKAAI